MGAEYRLSSALRRKMHPEQVEVVAVCGGESNRDKNTAGRVAPRDHVTDAFPSQPHRARRILQKFLAAGGRSG